MVEEYVNRKGQRYYLREGKTKTGKPKYYCSRERTGNCVASMPSGFEWREHPETAIVTVRRTRATHIAPIERAMLDRAVRERAGLDAFIIDATPDSLVVYLSDRDPDEVASYLRGLRERAIDAAAAREWTVKNTRYSPMMRFELCDKHDRLFTAYRWCFRGAIDDWILLSNKAPLADHLDDYVAHLGKDSFFELV